MTGRDTALRRGSAARYGGTVTKGEQAAMDAAAGLVRSILPLMLALGLAAAAPWPALAQAASGAPIGPCSPIPDPDGDIRSELPGCGRHARPVPGSLDDELAFRRTRRGAGNDAGGPRRRRSSRDEDDDPDE